jgi:hypothetical protein
MRALVCGTASCLPDDLAALEGYSFDRVYGVNAAPFLLPHVDVWVSGHAEFMPGWQARYLEDHDALPEIVSSRTRLHLVDGPCRIDRFEETLWDRQPGHRRDSGFFGVKVALQDGASRVVVAGIPLDDSWNLSGIMPVGERYNRYRLAWLWASMKRFEGRVRGMSGYPGRMLGKPTREWFDDRENVA